MYEDFGGAGSRLVLAPCNGASKRDVDALVEYIYTAPRPGGAKGGGCAGFTEWPTLATSASVAALPSARHVT